MKIIHTSDWHIGVDLYGHDRSADHIAFFDQLTELMATEHPDALVVSGDIYDRVLPSQAAQRLYLESILRLHSASPETEIIVTAGNHDSASRLELTRPLWAQFKVHVVGFIERKDDEVDREKHIIYVPGKGYVIALPFVYPHNYPAVEEGEDRQRAYVDALMQLVSERNTEGLPVVLMAHLAVAGSDFTGHKEIATKIAGSERTTVGNLEVETFDAMRTDYDYLALGHIHMPQFIRGSGGKAYYAGSPFAMGFDEVFPHSVVVVILEPGQVPVVTPVHIHTKRKLRTIPATPKPLVDVLKDLESEVGAEEEVFLRVNLAVEGVVPVGAEEKITQVLKSKSGATLCTIKYTNTHTSDTRELNQVEMYESVLGNDPLEIARLFMDSRSIPELQQEQYMCMIADIWQSIREEEQA